MPMGSCWSISDGEHCQAENRKGKAEKLMEYLYSFLIGGLICAAVQILLDRTKLMPGRVMVLLVCGGALLGFCGVYGPLQRIREDQGPASRCWVSAMRSGRA